MRSNSPSKIKGRQTAGTENQKQKRNPGHRPGKLFIVSLGPGDSQYLAPIAKEALLQSEIVVGYRTYMQLIDPILLEGKEALSTGMTDEIRRCQMAIAKAMEGKNTAVVSSGDAGVYGMAGLVLELLAEDPLGEEVTVEVIPGIPALTAAGALLGAPLMHDFSVISLSDLMTPWEVIQSRVEAAAKADFVIVIYNPRSKKRNWQLELALDLIRKYRDPETPVGMVRNAMRESQSVRISELAKLDPSEVDMLSILVVGNSQTRVIRDKMVTPRGYMEKYRA